MSTEVLETSTCYSPSSSHQVLYKKKQQQHMKQWENVTRSNVCVHQHHYHHRENSIQIYSHSSTNNRQKLYADCNGSMGMGEKVLYKGKTENCFLYFVFLSFCCCSSIFFHFVVCELTRIYSIVRAPNVCDENENQGPTAKMSTKDQRL